ncbi:uncharacterized protein LOC133305749 [Gastrolobium bilobum]|uniref:uncharacterized protein LOC133305749 n=1 Tax=Gastrolobium bilobum TaxID=150636 RepID=UPI002AB10F2B|nr:uncharacterized protein LOC133305749 [Gastrolobium bilobum]
MAEGTRSTVKGDLMEECISRLAKHDEQFNALSELLQSMNLKLTLMEAKLDQNQKFKGAHKGESSPDAGLNTFFGTNAYKSVKFTMDGTAEDWFHWMERNHRLTTWDSFVNALRSRFGPSKYRDLRGELGRLAQQTTVEEYQKLFEQLCNQIVGIDDLTLQSYFESGLKTEIRKEVRLHLPESLEDAISLAKVVEDKLTDRAPSRFGPYRNFTSNNSSNQPGLLPTPANGIVPYTPPSKTNIPIKRLSSAEMAEKREKGLCYYCEEKFHRNHKCKGQMFLLLIQDEDEDEIEVELEVTNEKIGGDDEIPGISLHAMAGQYSSSTLRLKGLINKKPVQVLVDGGSTQLCPGAHGEISGIRGSAHTSIQGAGAEVVLGVQWLSLLGDITTNYKKLHLKFKKNGQVIQLQGEPRLQVDTIELHQLRRLTNSDAVATYYQLQAIQQEPPLEQGSKECHSPAIQQLLQEYEDVFATPQQLPPVRVEDHQIHLEPGTKAVNVRPYRLVLECLRKHQLYAKRSKCSFGQEEIGYLGHIVGAQGVRPNTEKIQAIMDWQSPTTLKQLRGFLGLAGYYRKFVRDFSQIAAPLTALLRKDAFGWDDTAKRAMWELKGALSNPPILALPDFTKKFVLTTDASGVGIGAVLSQDNLPIAYFSKKLNSRMQQASTYVKEMFAITEGVSKWR